MFSIFTGSKSVALPFSQPLLSLSRVVAILILLTSSCDLILVINAGGNFRFCQITSVFLIGLALIKWTHGPRISIIGFGALSIWLCFQIAFIPTTDFWPKSVGYCLWLLLNLGMMFSFVQLFGDNVIALRRILHWYISSFGILAAFGILQFALPVFGLPSILVEQWWVPGILPRANGFSYEPSYFASYLMIGFVFIGSLRRTRSPLLSPRALLMIQYLVGAGILLSSSRMGIVFLLHDVLLAQMKPWLSFFADFRHFRVVPSKMKPLIPSFLSIAFLWGLGAGTATVLQNNPSTALIFLNGTGLSNTAAHSVIQREGAFEETLGVFWDHPWIGRSLGGVSSAIAQRDGDTIQSFEDSKRYEGMSVFAEILAASGIIGSIPFLVFLFVTIWQPLKLARQSDAFYSSLLRGLVRSLVFAWAILQFNQNVLRPYLWAHIAVLATVYAAAGNLQASRNASQPVRSSKGDSYNPCVQGNSAR
jgi:hypothetical protein